jgi:hypothetical protein
MNEPQSIPKGEHEVPSRLQDYRVIGSWLLRHPLIHFGVVFCYWFTAVSIVSPVVEHFSHQVAWSQFHITFFSFFMAVVFYIQHRHRLKIGYDVWLLKWASRLGLRKPLERAIKAKSAKGG